MKLRHLSAMLLLLPLSALHSQTAEREIRMIRLTDTVSCTSVKDQGSSPTCWVFGTNSLFESDLLKNQGISLNLSEMYIARYAYLDKIKAYLASGGKTYCEGGGQFHDVIRVIEKYGIVPEEVYNGRPTEQSYHNHAALDSGISHFIKQLVKEGNRMLTREQLRQINDTLDKYLGRVPAAFQYNGKTYTPELFAKEVVQYDNDYVELMSFADQPMYRKCRLNDRFNWAGDSLYNIPVEDLRRVADTALARGWSAGWEGDVTEPGFGFLAGYAVVKDDTISNDPARQRLSDFAILKTERDHMLHLVGTGEDEAGNKWYYLKNSWGTWFSHFKGYLYMSQQYFDLKTVVMMVNKKALPADLVKKLGL